MRSIPGCGPLCIPWNVPTGETVSGVPSCVGRCFYCVGSGASTMTPWYWHLDGAVRPEVPAVHEGYLGRASNRPSGYFLVLVAIPAILLVLLGAVWVL